MTIHTIHNLNSNKIFTVEEAQNLMPLLNKITTSTIQELSRLNSQLSFHKTNSEKAMSVQDQINQVLQQWSDKVRRLGTIPVALGKVRMQGDDIWYLWEPNRLFTH